LYTVGFSGVVERAVVQAIAHALIYPGIAIDDLDARDDLTNSLMPLLSGSTPRGSAGSGVRHAVLAISRGS